MSKQRVAAPKPTSTTTLVDSAHFHRVKRKEEYPRAVHHSFSYRYELDEVAGPPNRGLRAGSAIVVTRYRGRTPAWTIASPATGEVWRATSTFVAPLAENPMRYPPRVYGKRARTTTLSAGDVVAAAALPQPAVAGRPPDLPPEPPRASSWSEEFLAKATILAPPPAPAPAPARPPEPVAAHPDPLEAETLTLAGELADRAPGAPPAGELREFVRDLLAKAFSPDDKSRLF